MLFNCLIYTLSVRTKFGLNPEKVGSSLQVFTVCHFPFNKKLKPIKKCGATVHSKFDICKGLDQRKSRQKILERLSIQRTELFCRYTGQDVPLIALLIDFIIFLLDCVVFICFPGNWIVFHLGSQKSLDGSQIN